MIALLVKMSFLDEGDVVSQNMVRTMSTRHSHGREILKLTFYDSDEVLTLDLANWEILAVVPYKVIGD